MSSLLEPLIKPITLGGIKTAPADIKAVKGVAIFGFVKKAIMAFISVSSSSVFFFETGFLVCFPILREKGTILLAETAGLEGLEAGIKGIKPLDPLLRPKRELTV